MSLRTSTWGYRAALFSALGLAPLSACGGTTTTVEPGSGGAPGTGGSVTGSGGASATGGAAATGGVKGTGGSRNTTCVSKPILDGNGNPTGFETCGGGPYNPHRPEKKACSTDLRPADPRCQTGAQECTSNADCTAGDNGRCQLDFIPGPYCACAYGCISDDDCESGKICQCGDTYGKCVPATCTVDSDCGEGELCLGYDTTRGCHSIAFACTTPKDECHSDADCPGQWCAFADGAFRCQSGGCAVGRPFLVGGAARVAPVVPRSDWCSSLVPDTAGLDADTRAALGAHWTEIALMEHASIAAFARFALELVSLGAPASLIAETHAAMADETAHARDAFALASAYRGERIGPGAFDAATASLTGRTVEDIVHTTILEGCVGETVAAVEAAEALAGAADPAVREALGRVAADEARHAELAWRFVQWVIDKDPGGLRDVALRELDRVLDAPEPVAVVSEDVAPGALAAHGYIDDRRRAAIRAAVLADVVRPCARALAAPDVRRSEVRLRPASSCEMGS